MRCITALFTAASLSLLLAGCEPANNNPKAPAVNKNAHDHEHEEGHHHPGPNGGLVAEIGDKGDHHLEWTHDHAKNSVTLIVLDDAKKKEVPIAMGSVELVANGKTYTLEAVNPQDGKASRFELADPDLMGAIESLSDEITAEVKELDINGEKVSNVKLVEVHDHD